jgi:hypothetical protein
VRAAIAVVAIAALASCTSIETTADRFPAVGTDASRSSIECAPTSPNGGNPPGQQSRTSHGNGKLWVELWPHGIVRATEANMRADGSIAVKFPWTRGVRGKLAITGRRLDAEAPSIRAEIPNGYANTGFQASGIIFPTAGCWEITGRVGDVSLTFVTEVVKPPGAKKSIDGQLVSQQIRVSRDTSRGPRACQPEHVGRLVADFFAAVNRGEADRVTEFFTPGLGWYSVTEGNPNNGGRHFVAYKPSRLQKYFGDRVSRNERMYLVEIDVAYERAGNLGHVAYNLLRSADDLTEYAAEAGGKGAIDCEGGRIVVWSMGQGPKPQPAGTLCPGQPDPPHIAIACARD